MAEKPRILLVNDDGADAPGLWTLFQAIASIADPVVVAPMHEQSARGHAVTIRQRMALLPIEHHGRTVGYRLDGTPADCVKLALAHLFRDQIAMAISGINWGSNVGHNILYSGTVAAALEGAMYGLPAIAVSLRDEHDAPRHLETAAMVARQLTRDILEHGLPPGVVLNVNVPDLPLDEIEGTVLTRQGQEAYIDLFVSGRNGEGGDWCANIGGEKSPSGETDHALDDLTLSARRISVTPLQFNLTHEGALEAMRERIRGLRLIADGDFPPTNEPR